jgi:hypothetical protein
MMENGERLTGQSWLLRVHCLFVTGTGFSYFSSWVQSSLCFVCSLFGLHTGSYLVSPSIEVCSIVNKELILVPSLHSWCLLVTATGFTYFSMFRVRYPYLFLRFNLLCSAPISFFSASSGLLRKEDLGLWPFAANHVTSGRCIETTVLSA